MHTAAELEIVLDLTQLDEPFQIACSLCHLPHCTHPVQAMYGLAGLRSNAPAASGGGGDGGGGDGGDDDDPYSAPFLASRPSRLQRHLSKRASFMPQITHLLMVDELTNRLREFGVVSQDEEMAVQVRACFLTLLPP